jgi:hypothetical protein
MTRTAANATSMAIDSTGIKKTETGGRSPRYRSVRHHGIRNDN